MFFTLIKLKYERSAVFSLPRVKIKSLFREGIGTYLMQTRYLFSVIGSSLVVMENSMISGFGRPSFRANEEGYRQ